MALIFSTKSNSSFHLQTIPHNLALLQDNIFPDPIKLILPRGMDMFGRNMAKKTPTKPLLVTAWIAMLVKSIIYVELGDLVFRKLGDLVFRVLGEELHI